MRTDTEYRLELLKMARELLNEEYINRRAEDHNAWVAKCDVARKLNGSNVPYPPFAVYPSEHDIVAKAVALYNFVKPPELIEEKEIINDIELEPEDISTTSKIIVDPIVTPIRCAITMTRKVETSEVETSEVETPEVETPEVETPEVETPEVETPVEDVISSPYVDSMKSQYLSSQPTVGLKQMIPSWLQRATAK